MKTTAIIPVFNEERTIRNVLSTLLSSDLLNQVIVVDDGSTDKTPEIIRSFNQKKLRIISLKRNKGKSGAVKVAAKGLSTDILFFCDGDLHNFKKKHIKQILSPFRFEKKAMSVGIRDYGRVINFISKHGFPLISGERAVSYSIYQKVIDDPLMKGYGLEEVLNNYCKQNKIPIHKDVMKGVRQLNKPLKRKNGFYLLIRESLELIQVMIKLRFRNIKNH